MPSVLSMAYITTVWLVLSAPVTLVIAAAAAVAYRSGAQARLPIGISRWHGHASSSILVLLVCLGGLYHTPAVQPLPKLPTAGRSVIALYAALVVLAIVAVARAHRRWVAGVVMLMWVWVGAAVAWICFWSIDAGGSLGAL